MDERESGSMKPYKTMLSPVRGRNQFGWQDGSKNALVKKAK